MSAQALLLEEFLAREAQAGRLDALSKKLRPLDKRVLRKYPGAIVIAHGTSCRHQIQDGAQRESVHAAVLLARQIG